MDLFPASAFSMQLKSLKPLVNIMNRNGPGHMRNNIWGHRTRSKTKKGCLVEPGGWRPCCSSGWPSISPVGRQVRWWDFGQ